MADIYLSSYIPPVNYGFGRLLKQIINAQIISPVIHVYSDSTGYGTGDGGAWRQAAIALAQNYPQCTHRFAQWDDDNSILGNPSDLAVSNLGRRGMYQEPLGSLGYLSYLSSSFTNPTGDIDIQVQLKPTGSWTSLASSVAILARTNYPSGFKFSINTNGTLNWVSSNDGLTITVNVDSTAAVSFSSGATGWVRVYLKADAGSSNYNIFFYTSSDGISWTQLGTTIVGANTQAINWTSSGDYVIGGWSGGQSSPGFTYYCARLAKTQGGVNLFPEAIESWSIPDNSWTMVGGSTITWHIVARSGGNLDYWDATKISKSFILGPANFIILNDGHNYGVIGPTYLAYLDGFISRIATQINGITTPVYLACIQNPQVPTPSNNLTHYVPCDIRHMQFGQWARSNGFDIFDVSAIFSQVSSWQTLLVGTDGIHPTDAGYLLWGQTFAHLSTF